MNELVTIITGVSGTVLGGFLGYFLRIFIEHRLAIDRIKENIKITEFNKAAAAFRSTFVDEIFNIQKDPGPFFERFGVNREEIEIANEKAKIIFEVFLPSDQLEGFNAAWEQYKHPDEEREIKGPPWDPEYIKELGKIRLSHINTLLEYAKPKL